MAKFKIKGKKITGTKKKDKIVSTGKGIWKKAFTVNAGSGNDIINFKKSAFKNTINGQIGNDVIYGGKKNDKITGGKGSDKIYTGKGTNTLIINKGDGNDTIYHQGTKTIIKVNKALASDKKEFSRNGNDLLLTYTHGGTTTKEVLTFKNYFALKNKNIYLGNQKLEDLMNAKGMTITGRGNITGTNGNDVITGSASNDTITVPAGNNRINAGAGNDIINAGKGNDTINGGAGNDLINLSKGGKNEININKGDGADTIIGGSGNDTIVFSSEKLSDNENPSSVSAAFVGNDLIITGQNGGTKTTLKDYANGDHSVKWLVVGGETVRTDSIVPLNNINKPNTVSEYNIKSIYNGTSRPDYINISSTEYGKYGPTMVVNADKGDDVIEINSIFASDRTGDGRLYGVKVDAGEGNDNIILNSGALAQVVLKAGNGNDTISGIGYAGSGVYMGSGGYQLYNGSGGYVKYMNTGVFNEVVLDEEGLKGLLTRKLGSTEYILGKQVGNDLIIKLTNGETLTIENYYEYKYNKKLYFMKVLTDVLRYLRF